MSQPWLALPRVSEIMVKQALAEGRLCHVLTDDWHMGEDTFHAVYPSRNGILPTVKLLLDFLAEGFGEMGNGA